jgi:serine/threonine protein kinase/WD40 repeat protein
MSVVPSNDSDAPDDKLDQAIIEYLRAQEAGTRLDMPTFMAKHASVAADLETFINQQNKLGRLMSPVRKISDLAKPKPPALTEFGDYEIIREIGRGGMGIIYEAQQKGLTRRVALKMIRGNHFLTDESLIRFKAEAEAAAGLEHPNIVPVYRVGNVDGHPFFTMKLVRGGSLKEVLETGPIASKESARLACKIAQAISYAHQRGILHRDLKPANILLNMGSSSHSSSFAPNEGSTQTSASLQNDVAVPDSKSRANSSLPASGQTIPMVSDFGLAKQLDHELAHGLTLTGAVLGTPSYMSPEQASGDIALTTATDIYGVGGILFSMLTGKPPFDGSSPAEITRKVIEQAPNLSSENSTIDSDLKTICLKCLEKSPADRYVTSAELADDLQRYLSGKPIMARRASSVEQCIKWARRNPMMATLFSTIAALVVLTLVGSILFSFRLNNEVMKRGETLEDLKVQETRTAEERDRALRRLFESKFAEVAARRSSGESGRRFGALKAAKEAVSQLPFISATDHEIFELRSETAGCLGNVDLTEIAKWEAPGYRDVGSIDFSPDLNLFAYHTSRGTPVNIYHSAELARLGSATNATPIASIDIGEGIIGGPFRCQFSDCGTYLMVNSVEQGLIVQIVFDIETQSVILREEGVSHACVSETTDGSLIATADQDMISIRRLPDLVETISFANPSPSTNNLLKFSPDGKWLARFGDGGTFIFEVATGKIAWQISNFYSFDLDWHPSEMQIAVTDRSEFQIWQMEESSARKTATFPQHSHDVFQVEFTEDGSTVASSTWSGNSRFWDIQSGEQLFSFAGSIVRFSNDGSKVAFRGAQTGICRFEGKRLRRTVTKADAKHTGSQPIDLDVHPNNRWVAMGEKKGVRISDLKSGTQLVDLPGQGRVRFRPDGRSLLIGDETIEEWPIREEISNGHSKLMIGPPKTIFSFGAIQGMDIDPDGEFIASVDDGRTMVASLENPLKFVQMKSSPSAAGVSLSRGAKLVAVGNHLGSNAQVFDGLTGELLHTVKTPTHARARLSPDGDLLVVTFDNTAEVYETSGWKRIYSLHDSDFEVAWPASFSADGEYLLLTLRKPRGTLIVDARSGENLIRIPGASGTAPRDVHSMLTSDNQLVNIREGNSLEAWDLASIRKQLSEIGLDWKENNSKPNHAGSNETSPNSPSVKTAFVPDIEVRWKDGRLAAYENALAQTQFAYGDEVAKLTFEGWQNDSPTDPILWQARGNVNNRLEKRQALDDWSKAIECSGFNPELFYLRATTARRFNQLERVTADLTNFLNHPSIPKESRIRASQKLAWETLLNALDREVKKPELERVVELATAFDDWVTATQRKDSQTKIGNLQDLSNTIREFSNNPKAYLRRSELKVTADRVLANKTLALAKIKSEKFESAIRLLEEVAPTKTNKHFAEAYGVEFLLALAHSKQGDKGKADTHFQIELESKAKFARMYADDASDWMRLRSTVEAELGIEPKPRLRWTPIELASNAAWDVGGLRVQFFTKSKRFTDLKSQTFRSTEVAVENLFWSPKLPNGELTLNLMVDETGTYDGTLKLTHAIDYGLLEFSLNGVPVSGESLGTRFDGFLNQVVFGDEVKLNAVELRKGTNQLTIKNVGKSPLSRGYYAGIESLEFSKE